MERLRVFPRGAWRLAGAAAIVLAFAGFTRATRFLAVTSVVLSPPDVTAGGTSMGTVTLDEPTTSATIQLSSANTALATVPSSARILTTRARPTNSTTFTVQTSSGVFGCTEITARLGTTAARKALITVQPPAPPPGMRLTLARTTVVGAQGTTGTVTLINAPVGTHTVGLASSIPAAARVPASVNVTVTQNESLTIGSATFPISTTDMGSPPACPVITATRGTTTGRVLLRVFTLSG